MLPRTEIEPWSGIVNPTAKDISVDLPAPFTPTRAVMLPVAISNVQASSTFFLPKRLSTSCIVSADSCAVMMSPPAFRTDPLR